MTLNNKARYIKLSEVPVDLKSTIDYNCKITDEFCSLLSVYIESDCGDNEVDQDISFTVSSWNELSIVMNSLDMFSNNTYPFRVDSPVKVNLCLPASGIHLQCNGLIGDERVGKYLSLGMLQMYNLMTSAYITDMMASLDQSEYGIYLNKDSETDKHLIDINFIDVKELIIYRHRK